MVYMSKRCNNKKINMHNFSENVLELPSIDMVSNREASVWGTKGIIEYTKELIRLNCGNMVVSFKGLDLIMKALSVEDVIINGIISSVEFSDC